MTAQSRPCQDIDIVWRNLGYDLGWEASDSGVIRCGAVLNRRGDIFNAVEGVHLRAIACVRRSGTAFDLLRAGGQMRHVEVCPPRPFGPDRLYLTARLRPDGGAAGIFLAIAPSQDDGFEEQMSLLADMAGARLREETHRRESEMMLCGLRLLLSEATIAAKLDSLTGLMAEALDGAEHHLLRIAADGVLHGGNLGPPPAALRPALEQALRAQLSPVVLHRGGTPMAQALHVWLGAPHGDMASVALDVGAERIVLLCRARGDGFTPRHVDFAGRLALLLRQVLLLREEQDRLAQAARLSALGQMSASLAHELRQPLNTIAVAAQGLELLAQDGAPPAQILSKANRIRAQVERAGLIMERMRQFSRGNGHDFAPADLAALARGVAALATPMVREARAALLVDVPEGLTACCDAVQIEQVLVNLVRNALDALCGVGNAAGAARDGCILVTARRVPAGVVLRVEDNGPGFPSAALARPLESFFTTKAPASGTGLGLSICNSIARGHAGRLEIGNHAGGAFAELHLPDRAVMRPAGKSGRVHA